MRSAARGSGPGYAPTPFLGSSGRQASRIAAKLPAPAVGGRHWHVLHRGRLGRYLPRIAEAGVHLTPDERRNLKWLFRTPSQARSWMFDLWGRHWPRPKRRPWFPTKRLLCVAAEARAQPGHVKRRKFLHLNQPEPPHGGISLARSAGGPTGTAHLPGRLESRCAAQRRNAGPVRWCGLFGGPRSATTPTEDCLVRHAEKRYL